MKMKIAIASDLHLEFGSVTIKNSQQAQVLILSGDICVAADIQSLKSASFLDSARSNRIRDFFNQCAAEFPHVIMVMGNHEHYHGDFATTQTVLQQLLDQEGCSNVHLLEKTSATVDHVTFLGGTLWTSLNSRDSRTMSEIVRYLNDFQQIKNSSTPVSYRATVDGQAQFKTRTGKFTPNDLVNDHEACLEYICTQTDADPGSTFVVVGHHAPSPLSVAAQYAGQTLINGAYMSDLTDFITARPQIRLWTHGHTHHDFDYVIGQTRIVCNPRGYVGHEARADHWQLKYVDI
jgi:Icc-related predicted phosphoesterase